MVDRPAGVADEGDRVTIPPSSPLATPSHRSENGPGNVAGPAHPSPLALGSARDDVDQVCQQFESARGSSDPLTIQACLQGWEEPERSKLLCELIALELKWRQRAKVALDLEGIRQQFPDDPDAVAEAIARHENINTLCPSVGEDRLSIRSELHHMRFLAEGGLGQVFIAEDQTLRRETAIKLIREDLVNDASSCDQFRLEAEVTGRLDHPGIPVVYGIGMAKESRLFYVMKYVRGTGLDQLIRRYHKQSSRHRRTRWNPLAQLVGKSQWSHPSSAAIPIATASDPSSAQGARNDSRPPDLHELLTIFISICHTVGYAHRRGILHRDIKPGNVIHGKYGETITIDWGLALPVARQGVFKDHAEQTLTPLSGRSSRGSVGCIGTPAFMSPEQAAGNVPLTPASDIFSLGATLYCILTGRPPYQANSVQEVRQKAIECDYPPISEAAPSVPHPLQAICHKAMKRDISRRYRTTHDLIADLHAYLSDQPVSAVKESPYTHLARWTRHNTNLVLAAMLCTVILTLGVALLALRKSNALANQELALRHQIASTDKERELREGGLKMAADMAARTVAGKIDLAFRSLELAAHDDRLINYLTAYNESASDESGGQIQSWLNTTVAQRFQKMQYRAWFVMSRDGTTVARFPEYIDSVRASNIGKNWGFRDYFHGLGQDLPPGTVQVSPITKPNNSSIVFSTNDAELTAYFSVPIFNAEQIAIGVMVITVDRTSFFDIKAHKLEAQQLLLVETRGYPLLSVSWSELQNRYVADQRPQWSAGVVIHHEDVRFQQKFDDLHHVPRSSLRRMLELVRRDPTDGQPEITAHARLFSKEDRYRDPLGAIRASQEVTAAYAPVVIDTRDDPEVADTGWFVIIQQHAVPGGQ